MPTIVIGIDPGKTGALAVLEVTGGSVSAEGSATVLSHCWPMPLKPPSTLFPTKKTSIDPHTLAEQIRAVGPIDLAVIERVHSSPQMGVVSAFTFGEGYGAVMGVLAALNIRTVEVAPAVWKAGLSLSANKGESKTMAISLFPEWSATFTKGSKSADLAEAALIAYYGQRFITTK